MATHGCTAKLSEEAPVRDDHRRRVETEAKAKVVASVWGAKFIKFLAALAIFLGIFGRIG